MQKSQSAVEFIVLAAFMLLVTIGFFAVTSSKVLEADKEKIMKTTEGISNFAYREIEIAKSVNDGYTRVFAMPQSVNGVSYNIAIVDNRELVVNYLDYEFVRFLPSNVTGNITKGNNVIVKKNGVIYLQRFGAECNDTIDNDGDSYIDRQDAGCVDSSDDDETNCGDNVCESYEGCLFCSADCGQCASVLQLLMRTISRAVSFDSNGNVILKGTLEKNSVHQPTSEDEFIFKDRNGNNVAIIDLVTGNMYLVGDIFESQSLLNPSEASNDFIVTDTVGRVVSFIDEQGNLYLKGSLTENGAP